MKWFHLFTLKPISKLLGFIFSKNGAVFSIAIAIHSGGNFLVNVLLAGYVTFTCNVFLSIIILFFASSLKTIIMVRLYDHYGRDIFGIEAAKSGNFENRIIHRIKNIVHAFEKRGKFLTQLALMLADNFFGLAYIRSGSYVYNGIPRENYFIFLLSMLISGIAFTLGWEGAIKLYWILYSFYIQLFG